MSEGRKAASELGPVELEIITGTIRSAELEIEAAVERTSRSPMIRDQHDYRVALFDAKGRKLTGRSYSALVEPVFEYFAPDDIDPGDVFFWNDPYNSSGGIGHIPDLCSTLPIFHEGRLIGFSQVFGHHDDVGGSVPGSLPVHAEDMWTEGLVIPPIKLYEGGRVNEAAFRIIERNSRLSEHLRGDLDAEIGAAMLGSRRVVALAERYGADTLEAAFDAMIENCAETIRRELLPRIADGVYAWEDYIENDGVDAPRLHAMRVTMTKTAEKILLDFTGTSREARGPINWAIDYSDGKFVRKWMGPVLRSLAASPERAAEIDMNEGVLDVIDVKFPEKGTLVTPNFGKATGMRFFILLRSLGIFAALLLQGDRRADAGGSRDHPHLGAARRRLQPGLLPVPRGARRRRAGPALGRRLGRGPYRPQLAQPAGRVLRDALSRHGREAGTCARLRRGGVPPRRVRLRQAHPRARTLPAPVQR